MEDELSFLDWLEKETGFIDGQDLSGLVGISCPEGVLKTGIFLHEDQKRMLASIKQEVEQARGMWSAYTALSAVDPKVQPFQELCVQCYRCHLLSQCFWLSVKAIVPPKFYGFVGVGFDNDFEIWVGPGFRRDIGDLRSVFDLYPPMS